MARPSNREQRRGEILEAFSVELAERGYEGASIATVAARAELTPGLVHYHFKDKAEILVTLVALLCERVETHVQWARERADRTPQQRVEDFLDVFLSLREPRGDLNVDVACWIAIGSEAVRQESIRAPYRRFVGRMVGTLEELLAAAMRAAGRRSDDAQLMAPALFAAIQGYFTLSAASPGSIPPGSAAPSLRKIARGVVEGARKR